MNDGWFCWLVMVVRGAWAMDCGKLGVKGIFRSSFPLSFPPSFHLELLPVSILKVRD